MPTRSLKEDFVGEPPIRHSVELLELTDGNYQVVARLYPDRGDWEPQTVPPPGLILKDFGTKSEAEFYYRAMLSQFTKLGPP